MTDRPTIMDVPEAAEFLKVSRDWLYSMTSPKRRPKDSDFPKPVRRGRRVGFLEEDLIRFLKDQS